MRIELDDYCEGDCLKYIVKVCSFYILENESYQPERNHLDRFPYMAIQKEQLCHHAH